MAGLLGAADARRGVVPVEVSHPVPERLVGTSHYYGGPLFANSYAADPDRVLDVVLAAAHPAPETAERDREFVRPA